MGALSHGPPSSSRRRNSPSQKRGINPARLLAGLETPRRRRHQARDQTHEDVEPAPGGSSPQRHDERSLHAGGPERRVRLQRENRQASTARRIRSKDKQAHPRNGGEGPPFHVRGARHILGKGQALSRTEGQMEERVCPLPKEFAHGTVRLSGRAAGRLSVCPGSLTRRSLKDMSKMKPCYAVPIGPYLDKSALLKMRYQDASSILAMTSMTIAEIWSREKARLRRGCPFRQKDLDPYFTVGEIAEARRSLVKRLQGWARAEKRKE